MKIAIRMLSTSPVSPTDVAPLPFGEAEQARLLAIRNPAHACASLEAQKALLSLVGNAPSPIVRSPEGKPRFMRTDAPAFSLSHTDTLAVAAVAERGEGQIGVDLEELSHPRRAAQIADRFFTEREREQFAADPTPETFFLIWTAKEATAKKDGTGLSGLWAQKIPLAEHLRSYRILAGHTEAILSVATDCAAERVEWLCDPSLQIQEIQ